MPSLDGLVEAVVAAPTLAGAATALGMSVRSMRELGWRPVRGGIATRAAAQPGTPLYRNILGVAGRWEPDRAVAVARAARAARRGTAGGDRSA